MDEEETEVLLGGIGIGMFLMMACVLLGLGMHLILGTLTITGPVVDKIPYYGPFNVAAGIVAAGITLFLWREVSDRTNSTPSTRVDA